MIHQFTIGGVPVIQASFPSIVRGSEPEIDVISIVAFEEFREKQMDDNWALFKEDNVRLPSDCGDGVSCYELRRLFVHRSELLSKKIGTFPQVKVLCHISAVLALFFLTWPSPPEKDGAEILDDADSLLTRFYLCHLESLRW